MPLDLTGKMGPLPVWAWGGIIGVTVVGFSYWRTSHNAAVNAAPSYDSVDGAFGSASPNGSTPTDPGIAGGGGATTDPVPPALPDFSGTTPDFSNVDFQDTTSLNTWVARAILWLSGQGVSPANAQQALSDYLSGASLSSNSMAIVQQALSRFGAPPLGVDPATVDTSPAMPAAQRTPDNTPLPPDKPGYARRWNYTTHVWEYQQLTPEQAAAEAGTVHVATKPPDKAGYTTTWSPNNQVWYYVKNATTTSAPAKTSKPKTTTTSTKKATKTYTVRKGDTLGAIAARYGTTVSKIAAANGIKNVNLIRVGQTLTIP